MVSISNGFHSGDTLSVDGYTSPWEGIAWSYNANSGVLSLAGSSSAANYQTVLRAITFSSSSPVAGSRSVYFSLGSAVPFNDHFYEYVESVNIG